MGKATEKIGEVVGKGKAAAAQMTGDKGIFKKLEEEHAEVSTLMKRVSATEDEETRRELFPKIRKELLSHAKAEEKQFYPILEEHDETRTLAEQALREHHEVEQLLEQLQTMDFGSREWGEKFRALESNVQNHVQNEEKTIFPKTKGFLDEQQAESVEQAYASEKQRQMQQLA